ncbi:hypothetical protein IFM89_015714 [Coptis chinensis]|uniref:Uncharacterized protein n=1 Tax=Coptis chinensis TaxID=261450 RepID=A0A835IAE6_9MAGN|nr:hypothetical protein IFM89_015714 [Coptis chinensis]
MTKSEDSGSPGWSAAYLMRTHRGYDNSQFQKFQRQFTRVLKGSSPPAFEVKKAAYNPKVLTSLKRQWAWFQLHAMMRRNRFKLLPLSDALNKIVAVAVAVEDSPLRHHMIPHAGLGNVVLVFSYGKLGFNSLDVIDLKSVIGFAMKSSKRQRIGGLNSTRPALNMDYWLKLEEKHGSLLRIHHEDKVLVKYEFDQIIDDINKQLEFVSRASRKEVDGLLEDETELSDLSMVLEEKKKSDAEVEDKLGQLECDKIAIEILVEKYKTICDELIEKVDRLEDDLGMCRGKSSELMIALEDKKKVSIEFEDKLCKLEGDKVAHENELKEYKIVCEKLKEKVAHMEEDSKMVTERINFMAKDLQIYNDRFR